MSKKIIITHYQPSLHTMIDNAISKIDTKIDSQIRHYLHHLLAKTMQHPHYPQVNCEDIINYFYIKSHVSTDHLIMLADRSLLDIGLYPNQMSSSLITPEFMVVSGQQLYIDLSQQSPNTDPYEQISQNFIILMDILLCLREDFFHQAPLNQAFIHFLTHQTDSQFIRSQLKR